MGAIEERLRANLADLGGNEASSASAGGDGRAGTVGSADVNVVALRPAMVGRIPPAAGTGGWLA